MAQRVLFASLLFLVGCEAAELEVPGLDGASLDGAAGADSDGDGVSDADEEAMGTDPQSDDTDLDGWTDSEEMARNTDPTDGSDKPYQGGWPIGDCRYDIQGGSSVAAGEVAPDFTLTDMYGDDVRLHDFCHMAVMVVTGAEWCGPCQSYRAEMASLYSSYFESGLMIIDFLGETASGSEPTETDLENWADGHHYAVLADPGWSVSNQGYVSGGIPAMSLLAPGGVVIYSAGGGPTGAQIEEALPANFVMPESAYEDGAVH